MALGPTNNVVAIVTLSAGVSMWDLCQITTKPEEEVVEALRGVDAISGGNMRTHVYDLATALSAIYVRDAATEERLEAIIRKMKPANLPPGLQNHFWTAQSSRLSYQEQCLNLWHTDKVADLMSRVFKAMRESITQMEDNVDQQDTLSDRQRALVRQTGDSVLRQVQSLIRDELKTWDATTDREPLNPQLKDDHEHASGDEAGSLRNDSVADV